MKYLWGIAIVLFLVGCGAPKVLVSHKEDAEKAELAGNLNEAVEAWKLHFNQQPIEEIAGITFAQAAKTAFKAGDQNLAKSWFDQARYKDYSDAEMYFNLSKIYRSQKNISKELSALEFINKNFSKNGTSIDARLFDIYSEIKLNDKALQVWEKLDDTSKNDISKLESYFNIQKGLDNKEICDSVSLVLLEINPKHKKALGWNAKKYYWLGQNRYTSEMAKYNKKKTTKTYKYLLKQLDLVTADFKKSLPYLKTLWELEPGKEYAGYLANIYARFGDEKKANFYKKYRE